ncbi:MAG: hypothetical protein L0I02_00060 [Lactobacillus sp.]|nr:hypothetical protein [Lactobacillus sp.]MDN6052157.1 hypothetical protein [Lactobacillus sp.]
MENETTIDLRKLLALFKKHLFSIVFLTAGLGVIGWFVAKDDGYPAVYYRNAVTC